MYLLNYSISYKCNVYQDEYKSCDFLESEFTKWDYGDDGHQDAEEDDAELSVRGDAATGFKYCLKNIWMLDKDFITELVV